MISIITGTLNRIELLKYVVSNTVDRSDKLELILVDGGSTDGTIEYIKNLNHDRIKLIEVGERSFYPHFMNLGLKEAKYDWIAQWNDDVLLINDWDDVFNKLNDEISAYIFDWNRGTLENFERKKFDDKWISFSHCMNFGIYKKMIFKEIGMYDSKFKYYECDHDMTMRVLSFGYKVMTCHDIKVMEINTEKRSIVYGHEHEVLVCRNNVLEFYRHRKLPDTIEYLK